MKKEQVIKIPGKGTLVPQTVYVLFFDDGEDTKILDICISKASAQRELKHYVREEYYSSNDIEIIPWVLTY